MPRRGHAATRDGGAQGATVPPGDFSLVHGQEAAKRALEVAVAGGHHALFIGPPGAGKSMLGRCIPGLLPPLTPAEAEEVAAVYHLARLQPVAGPARLELRRHQVLRPGEPSKPLPIGVPIGGACDGAKAEPGGTHDHRGVASSGLEEALRAMQAMMKRLKLTVNESKTRVCRLPEDSFDFLGYTIGRCWSAKTGRAHLGPRPSRSRIQRLCREISWRTRRPTQLLDPKEQVARLNRMLVGWSNYFCLGPVSNAYRIVDRHTAGRLRQWLRGKHKLPGRATSRFPDSYLYETLGLVPLSKRTRHFPWAKA